MITCTFFGLIESASDSEGTLLAGTALTLVREALDRHEVNCALHVLCDGEKALDLLNRIDSESGPSQLDLLILDMHLPGRDGNEILGKLHSTKRYARTLSF
jgi:CheY-like chemotaxis protein